MCRGWPWGVDKGGSPEEASSGLSLEGYSERALLEERAAGSMGGVAGGAGSWAGEGESSTWHNSEEPVSVEGALGADRREPWWARSRAGSSGVRERA